ncbi:type I-E CRISPR-associated protein Cas7/Cse4/CasC [Nocardioides sp. NPDC101246]|uniref:type I-E CRISPR-associated protein Cas7/Cse4/CasC n=1 Tax=Nocardioides sp. NPDC101246 TaxID=3364336 RepID=UPI0037FF494B
MTTFIDVHVLQTVPSSNLNRDDTGSPKSATFGGVKRARVSSQAWKRATRRDFEAYLEDSDRGVRTRHIAEDLVKRIKGIDDTISTEEALELARKAFAPSGIKLAKPTRKKGEDDGRIDMDLSGYLVFASNQQLDALARVAVDGRGGDIDKAAAKAALKGGNGIEVALFGRMVADDTSYNVDAAVQVAHAISTHAVETEYDYFTAVDDAKPDEDDAGAGMIGVIEFNSSTLYRYATINLDQFLENVGDAENTARAVKAFVRSFVVSMPTGKLNTFANNTLPDAVLAQVRTRRPVNLVGAFETPVAAKPGSSISLQSAAELARVARETDAAYGTEPSAAYVVARGSDVGDVFAGCGERVDLAGLVEQVGERTVEALLERV